MQLDNSLAQTVGHLPFLFLLLLPSSRALLPQSFSPTLLALMCLPLLFLPLTLLLLQASPPSSFATVFAEPATLGTSNSLPSLPSSYSQTESGPAISISTNEIRYFPGQDVIVEGRVFFPSSPPSSSNTSSADKTYKVILEYTRLGDTKELLHRATLLVAASGNSGGSAAGGGTNNGTFTNNQVNAVHPGKYYVNATLLLPNNRHETAFTTFEVSDYFFNTPSLFMCFGLANFAALIILIAIDPKNDKIEKILSFVFLSGVAFSVIGTLALTDMQIGANSPVGLVVKGKEWVVNIGGDSTDMYAHGIQIPTNIVVFGVAGGYLRFLYNTARPDSRPDVNSKSTFDRSMADLATFFLAPLLAMALWLALSRGTGDAEGIYVMAALSFTVGLITDEVVRTLTRFAGKITGSEAPENAKKSAVEKIESQQRPQHEVGN
jgi:hypothetical protein